MSNNRKTENFLLLTLNFLRGVGEIVGNGGRGEG